MLYPSKGLKKYSSFQLFQGHAFDLIYAHKTMAFKCSSVLETEKNHSVTCSRNMDIGESLRCFF